MRLFSNLSIDPDIQGHIAIALVQLGERSIAPELLPLLSNEKVSVQARQIIADTLGAFGERSHIPEMLQLLSNSQVDKDVRKHIAIALGQLANDETTVRTLAECLKISDIQDVIHSVLWKVSREARVSVSIENGPSGRQIDICKW